MSTKTNANHKHLTLSDRTYIEQELFRGTSFKQIASTLQKDPTTISKEVRLHRQKLGSGYQLARCKKGCCLYLDCTVKPDDPGVHCDFKNTHRCRAKACHNCPFMRLEHCEHSIAFICRQPSKPPYVCNACPSVRTCPVSHFIYQATKAQKAYEHTLVASRQGINLTPKELRELDELISPLVIKGQPLSHIFAVHADEIPVTRRTLYNYLEQRVFKARNLDLPRRVRYKKRKKATTPRTKGCQQAYRNKRTYVDFQRYMECHPGTDVVEMDTVKGSRTSGKCLLTLLFRSCSFMIVILLKQCTQEEVIKAINSLSESFGLRLFRKYFPVILTDNGSEFKDPWSIEKTADGKHRTYVFYCDPYVSNQKARLEKNHEYIRYVIPKGRSMFRLRQEDANLLASHINSTARDSLNGVAPFDLADLLLDKRIPALTGIKRVPPDDILLKPALLSHNDDPR
jgi:IS30 family transposase